MRKLLLTAMSFGLLFGTMSSCSQSLSNEKYKGYEKVQENLYAQYHIDNDTGRVVMLNDIVSMEMMYKTESDSVLMDSRESGQDAQLQVTEPAYEGDILGAFIGMNVGDSASFIISADSFFLKTARMTELPPFVDAGSIMHFTVKITAVTNEEEMQAAQIKANEAGVLAEAEERAAYIEANNIVETPTESGLIFISKKKGTGKAAENGKKVKVNYSGQLLDGTYFDTSIEELAKSEGLYNPQRPYEPIEFVLGQGQVIRGWEEGIAMMKVGGKARFIIPSEIAYGAHPQPGGPIKPFSTLIFDVELVEVSDAGN